jgi:hypothetical protein
MPTPIRAEPVTGLDDPNRSWLQRRVRVRSHPEWGVARVVRWYPATAGQPERLRIFAPGMRAQELVQASDVELVSP